MAIQVHTEQDALGRILWLSDGKTDVAVALDYGLRVVHLSVAGMENLLYRQPEDCSDSFRTEAGWRLYGGHRLWLAPESDKSYFPDNDAVDYRIEKDGAIFIQPADTWQQTEKSLQLIFRDDGAVEVVHWVKNLSEQPLEAAPWSITTLKKGGIARVPLLPQGGAKRNLNKRILVFWGNTDPGDPRLKFLDNTLIACHQDRSEYFKMGTFAAQGIAVFENLGQRFTLGFDALPEAVYPDKGCNFELYMNRYFTELESLSPVRLLDLGQAAVHTEIWRLEKL